jgi:uncharacterized FlaG/YvyC family protein
VEVPILHSTLKGKERVSMMDTTASTMDPVFVGVPKEVTPDVGETPLSPLSMKQPAPEMEEPAQEFFHKEFMEEFKKKLDRTNVGVEFSTYGKNNRKVALVLYEKDSGEIIREIPPKELQLLHSKIRAWVGVVMDRYC